MSANTNPIPKTKKRSNRGGYRPGSGAKVKLIGAQVCKDYLDEDTITILTKLGSGNRSEGIRRAAQVISRMVPALKSETSPVIAAGVEEVTSYLKEQGVL